jgi:hypothetical protein
MNLYGILGIDSDVRNGYDDIKVTFISTPTPQRRTSRRTPRRRKNARPCTTS